MKPKKHPKIYDEEDGEFSYEGASAKDFFDSTDDEEEEEIEVEACDCGNCPECLGEECSCGANDCAICSGMEEFDDEELYGDELKDIQAEDEEETDA